MDYIKSVQEMASEIETKKPYEGYYYKVSDVITILVIGLLCNLKTAHEIYQWSCSEVTRDILAEHIQIEKVPCYAQFMNILGNVKADSLDSHFMSWCDLAPD